MIEDCAQAFGTRTPVGDQVGTRGTIGCFSLQQSKHITAGDGGLSVTDDDKLAVRMRLFADKGWPRDTGERTHLMYGVNYRITELTAAVARAQLPKVDAIVADRRSIAARLVQGLSDLPALRTVPADQVARHSFWLFPMWLDETAAGFGVRQFAAAVRAEGVELNPGYLDRPVHLNPALVERKVFGNNGFPLSSPPASTAPEYRTGCCPVAESMIARSLIAGPCNENYSDTDVHDYLSAIRKVYQGLTP